MPTLNIETKKGTLSVILREEFWHPNNFSARLVGTPEINPGATPDTTLQEARDYLFHKLRNDYLFKNRNIIYGIVEDHVNQANKP